VSHCNSIQEISRARCFVETATKPKFARRVETKAGVHLTALQQATAAQQQKQIEALTATVRKVSDQISLSKALPQFVANP
jgi:hypothetical protein